MKLSGKSNLDLENDASSKRTASVPLARTSSQQNLAVINSMKSGLGADETYSGDMKFLKSKHEKATERYSELQSKLQTYNEGNRTMTSINASATEAAAKMYSSVLSVLYCTIGLESLEKIELQVKTKGVSLPRNMFDLHEWLGVLDVARDCRNRIIEEYNNHIKSSDRSSSASRGSDVEGSDADVYPQLIRNLNAITESLHNRNLALEEELAMEREKVKAFSALIDKASSESSSSSSSTELSSLAGKLQRLEAELAEKRAAEERLAAMLEVERRARAAAELSEQRVASESSSSSSSSAELSSLAGKLQRLEAELAEKRAAEERLAAMLEVERRARAAAELSEQRVASESSSSSSSAELSSLAGKLQRLEAELAEKRAAEERLAAMLEVERRAHAAAELSEQRAASESSSSGSSPAMRSLLMRLESELSSVILSARTRVAEVMMEELASTGDTPSMQVTAAAAGGAEGVVRAARLVGDLRRELLVARSAAGEIMREEINAAAGSSLATSAASAVQPAAPPMIEPTVGLRTSQVSATDTGVPGITTGLMQVRLPGVSADDSVWALRHEVSDLRATVGELRREVRVLIMEGDSKDSEISRLKIKTSDIYKLMIDEVARAKKYRTPQSQVAVDGMIKRLSVQQIVRMQSWVRGFLAMKRARRFKTYKKIAKLGRLMALPKSKQGSTGWYEDDHGNCYYFTYAHRVWTMLVGPITSGQFGSLYDDCAKVQFFDKGSLTSNHLIMRLPFRHSFEHDVIGDDAVIYIDPENTQLVYCVQLDNMLELSRMYIRNTDIV